MSYLQTAVERDLDSDSLLPKLRELKRISDASLVGRQFGERDATSNTDGPSAEGTKELSKGRSEIDDIMH